jgi:nucleoside-diphosphate-sugar epimerase
MTTAVLGATGRVGSEIVRGLLDQRDRGLPHLRRLPHHLLPLGRPRPALWAGRAAALAADRGQDQGVKTQARHLALAAAPVTVTVASPMAHLPVRS